MGTAASFSTSVPIRQTFRILSAVPNLVHGVFTRHGGVSLPPYQSLNVAWRNGDQEAAVERNLALVREALGLKVIVSAPQVHGDTVQVVDEPLCTRLKHRSPVLVAPPGDGLVTSLGELGLMVKIADCQAVFLVDPVHQVVANVHCGWRGSVCGILQKTVALLQDRFQSRPEQLLAAISPSLGPCCAEFRHYRAELPEVFWSFRSGKQHFDFWAISRWQLESAGLRPEHIEIAGECTVCGQDRYFSYRAEKVTGRMAAVIGWKTDG
jgi:hypothetical protein